MQYNFSKFKEGLKKAEDYLAKEYRELNIGRASPAVLDGIMIESYGARMPLKNVASVTIEDQKTLRIVPWDKGHIKEIEKAVTVSNLGLSTAVDEAGIRVIFPHLTTETREKLVRLLKERLEDARITVRKERESVWDDIQSQEKAGQMTEDEKFKAKDALQKLVDEANKSLETNFDSKQKEVLG
ncbi:MAG TPA: ribosome recycling factor [Candidatus Paceibacterota bacterium]|nr:ribosome recycling factor [Candidatus Paceibacterota bacterium]